MTMRNYTEKELADINRRARECANRQTAEQKARLRAARIERAKLALAAGCAVLSGFAIGVAMMGGLGWPLC